MVIVEALDGLFYGIKAAYPTGVAEEGTGVDARRKPVWEGNSGRNLVDEVARGG
jgi:hypothetical protein